MTKMRRLLLSLLLSLAAVAAAAAATIGTLWCAQEGKPRRGVIFAVVMIAAAAMCLVFCRESWVWLLLLEGLYLTLFLFVRSFHSSC